MGASKIKKYLSFLESSNSDDMWSILPESVKDIHKLFLGRKKKLFVVGGAVRDFIKGDVPKDFDLCTDAFPEEVLDILKSQYKTNIQGKSFGVIVVYTDDQPNGMEIATFRSDTYDGKSRNPKVEYTTIDNDVSRRDITINGLFYDLGERKIIDLVNGVVDIHNKIIRMIGDPQKRIEEDPLRVLRSVRFSYRYGFNLDVETRLGIIKSKDSLSIISKERIWEEIKKSYSYKKNFKNYLLLINGLNLWENIFPNSNINTEIKECKYLHTYLANLFLEENLNLEKKLVLDYKIESEVSSKVCFLISFLTLSNDNVFDMFKLKIKCGISNDIIQDWINIQNLNDGIFSSFLKYKPTVSSEELMELGFKGKSLGDEIKKRESEEFKKTYESNFI